MRRVGVLSVGPASGNAATDAFKQGMQDLGWVEGRTVEYRVYYADYQPVNGAMFPHKIQRSIDGKPTEEMVFDKIKVKPKIDAKTLQPINK